MLLSSRSAKERKVRIWKDYVAPTANLDQKDRQFVAKVIRDQDWEGLKYWSLRYTYGFDLHEDSCQLPTWIKPMAITLNYDASY